MPAGRICRCVARTPARTGMPHGLGTTLLQELQDYDLCNLGYPIAHGCTGVA